MFIGRFPVAADGETHFPGAGVLDCFRHIAGLFPEDARAPTSEFAPAVSLCGGRDRGMWSAWLGYLRRAAVAR